MKVWFLCPRDPTPKGFPFPILLLLSKEFVLLRLPNRRCIFHKHQLFPIFPIPPLKWLQKLWCTAFHSTLLLINMHTRPCFLLLLCSNITWAIYIPLFQMKALPVLIFPILGLLLPSWIPISWCPLPRLLRSICCLQCPAQINLWWIMKCYKCNKMLSFLKWRKMVRALLLWINE